MFMHASVNNTKDILPSAVPGGTNTSGLSASLVGWITVALLWVIDAYFLFRMAARRPPVEQREPRGKMECKEEDVA